MNQSYSSSLSALQELASIRDFVLKAQDTLKSGKMPDMTALEQRTADLCRIIRESSNDVQKKCAPELKDLAGQLDTCEQQLRSFYETIIAPMEKKQ